MSPRPAPPYDRFDLTGRVALITGGTRGLGRAIIQTLAQAGADVVVSSRKQDACDEAAEEARSFGRRALAHACHVGRWDEIDELVDAAYAEFGRIDILVNNAGIAPTYPDAQSVTEELWDKVIAVNLKGPFRLTALVGSRMAAGDGGSIVNITSIGAVRPTHDILPYAAAKAGLNALTLGFADAFGPKVRVNAVMPGPFLTDISRELEPRGVRRARAHVPAASRRRAGGARLGRPLLRERRVELHDRLRARGRRRRAVEPRRRRRPVRRVRQEPLRRARKTGPDGDAFLAADAQLDPLSRRRRERAGRRDGAGLAARGRARGRGRAPASATSVSTISPSPERDPDEVAALLRAHGLACTDVGVLRVGAGEIRAQAEALAALASATGAGVCIAALYTRDAGRGDPRPAHGRGRARRRGRPHRARVRPVRRAADARPTRSTSAPPSAGSAAGCSSTPGTSSAATSRGRCSARSTADQIALVHVNDAPAPERDLVYESRFRRAAARRRAPSGSPSSPPRSPRPATTASSASRCSPRALRRATAGRRRAGAARFRCTAPGRSIRRVL